MPAKLLVTLSLLSLLLSACLGNPNHPSSWRPLPPEAKIDRTGKVIASATVVKVSDGDTLKVEGKDGQRYTIRLHAIDAPEKKQAHGKRCKAVLTRLAYQKQAQLEAVDIDRYQRVVAKVVVNDVDIGLEQIRQGCAWHYTRYASQQSQADRTAYAQAETAARQHHVGLWNAARPLAPWEYRRRY